MWLFLTFWVPSFQHSYVTLKIFKRSGQSLLCLCKIAKKGFQGRTKSQTLKHLVVLIPGWGRPLHSGPETWTRLNRASQWSSAAPTTPPSAAAAAAAAATTHTRTHLRKYQKLLRYDMLTLAFLMTLAKVRCSDAGWWKVVNQLASGEVILATPATVNTL